MAKIKIGDLAAEISKELENYGEIVNRQVADIVDEVAEETVKDLIETSPRGRRKKYRKKWKSKVTSAGAWAHGRTVYSDEYQLTHLLEHGHALKRGGRTIGQSKALPHIAKAEQKAKDTFTRKIEETL